MPLVSESYRTPARSYTLRRVTRFLEKGESIEDPPDTKVIADGVIKSQTGWRSGALAPPEREAMKNTTGWAAATQQALQAADNYDRISSKARAFLVNDRDFQITDTHAAGIRAEITAAPKLYMSPPDKQVTRWEFEGYLHARSFTGILPAPEQTLQATRAMAAEMFRQSIPTAPEIDLTLFIGELKDLPKLFARAAYAPKSAKEAGGAYLNQVFGLQPTLSDILKICEIIVKMVPQLKQFQRDSGNQVRRKRYRQLWEHNNGGVTTIPNASRLGTLTLGGVTLQYGGVHYVPTGAGVPYVPELSWSLTASESVRMFATFEYFIPQPSGLAGRLDNYKRQAERVLGSGVTPGLLYDLSPFSWLVDWFIDIGGLLRYQEQVASFNVVATKAGHIYQRDLDFVAQITRYYDKRPTLGVGDRPMDGYRIKSNDSTMLSFRKERRRRGSPYSMDPTWNFSKSQWGILGALGLAMSPEVPWLR